MALGGGTWTAQNKILPGAYINVASAAGGLQLGERGIAAAALELDWGPAGTVQAVTESAFSSRSQELFGYSCEAEELRPIRELFAHANQLYLYRLAKNAAAASGNLQAAKFAGAVWPGTRGNRLTVQVVKSVDDSGSFEVSTYLDNTLVETQTVAKAEDLKDNAFVRFEKTVTLAAGTVTLSGGTNGDAVTGEEHQAFLDAAEPYSFNVLLCAVQDETTKALYAAYTKRMREKVGKKFQCVVYRYAGDYEGVVSVENKVLDAGAQEWAAVYWTAGTLAGCAVSEELTNMIYDGEYAIDTEYRQADLENAILNGKFIFHRQGDSVRVLEDINTLVTVTESKGEVFRQNMTVRVVDQIAMDVAALFNDTYNGKVPNDEDGRIGLQTGICEILKSIQNDRAIQNFSEEDVTVSAGASAKAVTAEVAVQVTGMMDKLYMTVTVQ